MCKSVYNSNDMFTLKPTIRANRANSENKAQVIISISKKNRRAEFPTGVRVSLDEWDKLKGEATGRNAKAINNIIAVHMASVQMKAYQLELENPAAIPSELLAQLRGKVKNKVTFMSQLEKHARNADTGGTADLYLATKRRMLAYKSDADKLTFEQIDVDWLNGFEAFMAKTCSKNARNIHLRNIRTVFNRSIDDEITTAYPFRKFKVRPEPTRKRALTVDKFRELMAFDCESADAPHRDMFLLIFMLIGINITDLHGAFAANIIDGRLEYCRAKTHKLYSIKIEPEALSLIQKHAGTTKLINIAERYRTAHDWGRRINEGLRRIGPFERKGLGGKKIIKPLCPELTTYWARHTWATIAASLDIPRDTIAHALGHGGNTVTDIYIDFDQAKVDEANRRVLDWVLYGKK